MSEQKPASHTISVQAASVTDFRDGVHRAVCSCGWSGRQRRSPDGAMAEAQRHIFELVAGQPGKDLRQRAGLVGRDGIQAAARRHRSRRAGS